MHHDTDTESATRMQGKGLWCAGDLDCGCHECRAEEREHARWSGQQVMRERARCAGVVWEVSE